jgi:5'-nucleotidase
VHLAVTGMLDELPDMVVSGINHGANMGDDTIYSGTVAAATEASCWACRPSPSRWWPRALRFFRCGADCPELVERFQRDPVKVPTLLNVNVPDLPFDQIKGIQVTPRQAPQGRADHQVRHPAQRDRVLGRCGRAAQDAGEGTDFHAVANGYVRSPLQIDLTHQGQIATVRDWLGK